MRLLCVVVVGFAALAVSAYGDGGSPLPAFAGCSPTDPQIRPLEILVACGDGNLYISALVWSRWSRTNAVGTGISHQNDCQPYCVSGHWHRFRVTVSLSRPRACRSGHLFTRLTYVVRDEPKDGVVITRRETLKAPFRVQSGCP